jgi:hypothetical protein
MKKKKINFNLKNVKYHKKKNIFLNIDFFGLNYILIKLS